MSDNLPLLSPPPEKRKKKDEERLSDRKDIMNTVDVSYFMKTQVLPNLIIEKDIDFCVKVSESFGFLLIPYIATTVYRTQHYDKMSTFCLFCSHGGIRLARWLVDKFGITTDDIKFYGNFVFDSSCENGHLKVAKWLVDNFGLPVHDTRFHNNRVFRYTCENGHLEVAKWLVEKFGITADDIRFSYDNYAFRYACANGHLEVAKWLVERFGLTADDIRSCINEVCYGVFKNGNFELAKWLIVKSETTEIRHLPPL